jgi:hypothetical protein
VSKLLEQGGITIEAGGLTQEVGECFDDCAAFLAWIDSKDIAVAWTGWAWFDGLNACTEELGEAILALLPDSVLFGAGTRVASDQPFFDWMVQSIFTLPEIECTSEEVTFTWLERIIWSLHWVCYESSPGVYTVEFMLFVQLEQNLNGGGWVLSESFCSALTTDVKAFAACCDLPALPEVFCFTSWTGDPICAEDVLEFRHDGVVECTACYYYPTGNACVAFSDP